jgi:hypothetical protein
MVAAALAMTDDPLLKHASTPLATYANYCEVGHNAFEFLLDFGQFQPEVETVHVHTRIVTGPVLAKLFARLLTDAIVRFEAAHGLIAEFTDDDAFGALLASIPDFERRAIRARSSPLNPPGAAAPLAPR